MLRFKKPIINCIYDVWNISIVGLNVSAMIKIVSLYGLILELHDCSNRMVQRFRWLNVEKWYDKMFKYYIFVFGFYTTRNDPQLKKRPITMRVSNVKLLRHNCSIKRIKNIQSISLHRKKHIRYLLMPFVWYFFKKYYIPCHNKNIWLQNLLFTILYVYSVISTQLKRTLRIV